ncbi:rhodanese-like domain-containing protein [Seonamhaeicola maritimus]|uniref:Rhodanese-like domain-containing protein n=1 Tax=Seonamhaeicola maritimus TaxID=2591822 RepID=A0A5C7GE86_9FLAO|nr:rhodanese-like domain-containing protein [Seonamhaeicola maritimus]TXG35305.1 rhodanese-like domain-containing protein [Seonamhaeicola maritimus]
MKELEKTKRLSIAAVLTILVILIALLSYKRPEHLYTVNTQDTLEKVVNNNYLITLEDLNQENHVLVDVRNSFDFNKGHLDNAINITSPEILEDDNSRIINKIKEENKTIVLYGNTPNETTLPYLLLSQLGYDNLKILTVKNSYNQNKLITENFVIENNATDIDAFIQESVKNKEAAMKKLKARAIPKVQPTPKKVIPVKKKKKMPIEGGC